MRWTHWTGTEEANHVCSELLVDLSSRNGNDQLWSWPKTLRGTSERTELGESKACKDTCWEEETRRSHEDAGIATVGWRNAASTQIPYSESRFLGTRQTWYRRSDQVVGKTHEGTARECVQWLERIRSLSERRPRLVCEYWPQRFQKELTVFCDSDQAGCIITRRSTAGLVTMWDDTVSRIQATSNPQFRFQGAKVNTRRSWRPVVDTSPTTWLEPRNKAEGQVRFFSRNHTAWPKRGDCVWQFS